MTGIFTHAVFSQQGCSEIKMEIKNKYFIFIRCLMNDDVTRSECLINSSGISTCLEMYIHIYKKYNQNKVLAPFCKMKAH